MTVVRRLYEGRVERMLLRWLTRWVERWGGGVRTFEAAMLLTSDKGVVFTGPDGSEYQITIVQSKVAR